MAALNSPIQGWERYPLNFRGFLIGEDAQYAYNRLRNDASRLFSADESQPQAQICSISNVEGLIMDTIENFQQVDLVLGVVYPAKTL
jgi:hypothetical protein